MKLRKPGALKSKEVNRHALPKACEWQSLCLIHPYSLNFLSLRFLHMINTCYIYSGLFPLSLLQSGRLAERLEYVLSKQHFPFGMINRNSNQHTLVKFYFLICCSRTASSSSICFQSYCRKHFNMFCHCIMSHHPSRMSFFPVSSLSTILMLHTLVFFMTACYVSWCWLGIHPERLGHFVAINSSKILMA